MRFCEFSQIDKNAHRLFSIVIVCEYEPAFQLFLDKPQVGIGPTTFCFMVLIKLPHEAFYHADALPLSYWGDKKNLLK